MKICGSKITVGLALLLAFALVMPGRRPGTDGLLSGL